MAVCNRLNKRLDVIDEQQRLFTYTDSYAPLQNPAPAYVTPTAEPYFDNQPQPYFHNQPPPSHDNHHPPHHVHTWQPDYQPLRPPDPVLDQYAQQHTYKQPTYLLYTEPYGQSLYPPDTDPWQQYQLVYRPPSPTGWSPPPQRSSSCEDPPSIQCSAAPLPPAVPPPIPPPAYCVLNEEEDEEEFHVPKVIDEAHDGVEPVVETPAKIDEAPKKSCDAFLTHLKVTPATLSPLLVVAVSLSVIERGE